MVIKTIMVSTRKKKQQNKRFLSELDETADNFSIGNTIMNIKNTSVVHKGLENVLSFNANCSTTVRFSQADMETLQKNISDTVRFKKEDVVATLKSWIHEKFCLRWVILVVPKIELAMRSVGVFSTYNPSGVVLDPDQRNFSGDTNSLQLTPLVFLT